MHVLCIASNSNDLQGEKSIVTLGVILLFYGLSQEEDIFFRVGRKERLCTTENQRPELPWAVPPTNGSPLLAKQRRHVTDPPSLPRTNQTRTTTSRGSASIPATSPICPRKATRPSPIQRTKLHSPRISTSPPRARTPPLPPLYKSAPHPVRLPTNESPNHHRALSISISPPPPS